MALTLSLSTPRCRRRAMRLLRRTLRSGARITGLAHDLDHAGISFRVGFLLRRWGVASSFATHDVAMSCLALARRAELADVADVAVDVPQLDTGSGDVGVDLMARSCCDHVLGALVLRASRARKRLECCWIPPRRGRRSGPTRGRSAPTISGRESQRSLMSTRRFGEPEGVQSHRCSITRREMICMIEIQRTAAALVGAVLGLIQCPALMAAMRLPRGPAARRSPTSGTAGAIGMQLNRGCRRGGLHVRASMQSSWFGNPDGALHAGVITSALDSASGAAVGALGQSAW